MTTGKYYRRKLCAISLFISAVFSLPAQSPRVETVTIADGLSQGMIYDIEQTDDGFLWFATKDGLNRYDGYGFEVFTNDPFNPFSIAGNDVNCLFEDSKGNLWVSVFGKGLDVLEKNTGRFFHLPLNTVKDVATSPPYVAEGPDGSIWVGTSDGLLRLRWNKALQLDQPSLKASMSVQVVWMGSGNGKTQFFQPLVQTDGTVLTSIFTDGIYRFNPANGQYTLLLPTPNPLDKTSFYESAPGRVWILVDKRLYFLEGDSPREIPLAIPSNDYRLMRLVADGKGNLVWCYSSFTNGSFFYVAKEEDVLQGKGVSHAEMIYKCEHHSPWFELDKSSDLWIGTNGYGLRKIHLYRRSFQHLLKGTSIMNILIGDDIYINNYGRGGCDRLDEISNSLVSVPDFPTDVLIYNMCRGRKGAAWFFTGVQTNDQYFLGIRQNGQTGYRSIPPVNQFSPMREDAQGRLWAGAEGSRLMCVLPVDESIVYFNLPAQLGANARVHDLYFDKAQNLWVGTSNGIVRISLNELVIPVSNGHEAGNIKISAYQVYQTEATNPKSLRHNYVTAFCPDPLRPERYLWVSTKGGGLNLLDITNRSFDHFTTKNSGLPNDVIYGILPDDSGDIWGGTNRGLFRLRLGKEHNGQHTVNFRNFREFDGLQSDEFNTGALAKGPDGRLYFGGVNGLTVFNPAGIKDRKSDAAVQLTGLKINNLPTDYFKKNSPLSRPICRTEAIELDHTQNILSLEFALMDFVNPNENRFRYRLAGVDPDWVEAGTSHIANYSQLRPGSYTFEVQGRIGGGEWSQPASLQITVLPPWWATWWAFSLYALALSTAIYAFYRFRLRQKLGEQEAKRLRELDEFKSRFFTNITHEFRTPLTVILGNLEIMNLEIGKLTSRFPISQFLISKISMTRRNAESLLRLINQLLDLAKLESNSLKINYVKGDILPYLRYICESLHSIANARNVMVRLEIREPEIVMDYDPERLLQIVHNLLSNAIKFTPSGGRVTLRADYPPGNFRDGNLMLTVSDTGVGIPPEDLPKIFDRFYQAKNQEHAKAGGTGIGLSLTKELVKAMGGQISVESEVGKGTVFTVLLPLTQSLTSPLTPPLTPKGEPLIFNPAENFITKTNSELPGAGSPLGVRGGVRGGSLNHEGTPSILLIEDNPDVVEYLAACLGGDYVLDFAYNGRAGIEKALETVPDLIISDVMMPEKDGYEVCDFLKNDERTSHIPIILLTAKAGVESRIAGLKRGADAYLAKPFHREELLITIANLLEIRRKLQAKYREAALQPASITNQKTVVSLATDPENEFLKKLRLIIEENLSDTELDGEMICRKIGMSRSNLHAKLSALTGMPVTHFIRTLRLRKAKELLSSTTMNVSEVAYEVGFDNPKYFTRLFSEEFGMPPTEFRKI